MISVIIPSFNHDRYIESCIHSVLNQSYFDIELIVVDDGSQDRTRSYLRTIRDSRFKLIEQENKGAHEAINRGISSARGDYITILNSDDLFELNRLDEIINFMSNNEVSFCSTWIKLIDDNNNVNGIKKGWENCFPKWMKNYSDKGDFNQKYKRNLLISNFISTTSNIVMRNDVVKEVGLFENLRFVHDWDFALRAASKTKVYCGSLASESVRYRLHATNTIKSDFNWMMFEVCWIRAKYSEIMMEAINFKNKQDRLEYEQLLDLGPYNKVVEKIIDFTSSRDISREACFKLLLDDVTQRKQFIDFISECSGVIE
ncbi:glycosyltransferase family 2 protein [Aeromonas veronii]|uniref:glycosyltransferase family 2 protein n=1 Tax=Aeromonas veronii TaxID=654 RepID=UPI003F7A18AC